MIKFAILCIVSSLFLISCASSDKSVTAERSVDKSGEFQTEVNQAEIALAQDGEIEMSLPDDVEFEQLEEDFASVNRDQLKKDIAQISDQIIETEQELEDAKSLLSQMIEKDQPANLIETQKSKVVVLEDQLFDLNDEKVLKEIEAEVTE
jgi:L-cysteine desulfidase